MNRKAEKGMIFTAESVRAILGGTKTMTRRVVTHRDGEIQQADRVVLRDDGKWQFYLPGAEAPWLRIYPDYKVGDIIYVKETWGVFAGIYCYKAGTSNNDPFVPEKWRSPMFMPKAAARIWLCVINVRVERLQEISEIDVFKEGFRGYFDINSNRFYPEGFFFKESWDEINGKRDKGAYKWENNPWVLIYEFERITPEAAQAECDRRNSAMKGE